MGKRFAISTDSARQLVDVFVDEMIDLITQHDGLSLKRLGRWKVFPAKMPRKAKQHAENASKEAPDIYYKVAFSASRELKGAVNP